MSQTRRLAAILAADVAGYSRLMGADEEGTLERLKALRRELLDPKIAEHHGRIVKTTGDGLLAEFASVVDAVRCAVEVQQAVPERNTGLGADNRIELRIGINLGDVIVEGDDTPADRMLFALKCCCIAVLFCLVTGVEAVAHERLFSPAFDPLSGFETRRLRVNQRYLQNTLEQIVVFTAGLFGLAAYCPDGSAMRAVLAR